MQQPIRRLCDWTPDAGDETEWLERWERAGWWVPEHGYGVEVQVGGRWVKRYAMGRVGSLADPRKWTGS